MKHFQSFASPVTQEAVWTFGILSAMTTFKLMAHGLCALLALSTQVGAFVPRSHTRVPTNRASVILSRPVAVVYAPKASTALKASPRAATERKLSSIVNWKWVVPALVLGLARPCMANVLSMAKTNYYWQLNLVKNVLTLLGATFVIRSQTNLKSTSWAGQLLATGLVAWGVRWVTSTAPIPFYGVNIANQAFCLWAIASTVAYVKAQRQRRRVEAFRKEATMSAEVETTAPEDVLDADELESTPTEDEVTSEPESSVSAAQPIRKQAAPKNIAVSETVDDWIKNLGTIQDELKGLQMNSIPDLFENNVVNKTQTSLNKLQSETIPDYFKDFKIR